MNIYNYNDYREIISEVIKQSKKNIKKELTLSGLAVASQVQPAYVTRVLKGNAHLNSDQLYLACKYLKLTEQEATYMFLLLELSRSIVQLRKKELQKIIKDIQSQQRDTRRHLKADMMDLLGIGDYNKYYLDPLAPLIHVFLSLTLYSKTPQALKEKLNISENRLNKTLQTLESLKIIRWNSDEKRYEITKEQMQLVAESPLNTAYQIFQRNNTIQKIQGQSIDEKFIFSVTFSTDEKAKNEIHDEFLKFLRRVESLVNKSTPTDVYQMNFDLFGWT